MRDYYSNQDPPRSSPHTAPSITPYLGLRARLSQIWINRWTILLLLVLARTLIGISSLDHNLSSARREALSACSDVESMGSAMASMPHYMSQGVNEMAASGVEKAVNGLMAMTMLSVTGVEEIVLFIINMMTSTYLCLITFAVSGSLHAVIGAIEEAQDDLNKITKNIGTDIADVTDTFADAYNKFMKSVAGSAFSTLTGNPPTEIDLTGQIKQLQNLTLPSNLDADLQKLNNSIPTFDQVHNFTNNAIRFPFEEVKNLINNSLGTFTFDRSLFPVPQKEQLTFCSDSDGINDFFDDLVDLASLAKKIFIGVLLGAAILVCIPMAYREIKRWRTMQERAQLVGSAAHDPMDVVYIVSRPYTSTAGIKVADKNASKTRRQNLVRWVIAYATTDAALFVLALAIAGLFSCACQAIMLKALEKEIPDLTNQVGAFADQVVAQLNNASEQWAVSTNAAIDSTNRDINQNMLSWVNITTGALNNTLNVFVNTTMDALNETFGGTPLYKPIVEVLNCLVLLKVKGIENGLTWISDNAHVDFPHLPNDTFSLGAVDSIASDNSNPSDSFLSGPGDQASDKISSAVTRVINALQEALRTEVLISLVVLGIWVFNLLIAIARASTLWFGRDKQRGEGGVAPSDIRTQDFPPAGLPIDFRSDDQDRFTDIPLGKIHNAGPFTPAPEYTENKDPFSSQEDRFSDQKVGFAGQRNFYSSVNNDGNRIMSLRASVWDAKR